MQRFGVELNFFPERSTLRSCKYVSALAVAAVLFLTGCRHHTVSTHNGIASVRLQLDWYPQPEHGGFYTALNLGYYKAEGLDVTISPLPQYGSVGQLVATGKADIGLARMDCR